MKPSSDCAPDQFNKTMAKTKKTLSVSASIGVITAILAPAPVYAQLATDDATAITELVALEGQDLDGLTLGGFLPVVVGGDGDLLFLSRTANDSFITFDGNLDIVTNADPFGLQNIVRPTYSIDSLGDGFAITTVNGIVTGNVSDNVGTALTFGTSFDGIPIRDQGNLGDGATPIILDGQTALLLSDIGITESDGSFIGNTDNFVLFAGMGATEFEEVTAFLAEPAFATSLNFAGTDNLFASFSPLLASANAAQTSNLFSVDISAGTVAASDQIGPNGDPQIVNGMLSGGDLDFAGFTFFGSGGFNTGANYDSREFSANSTDAAFVLGNAGLALDGTAGSDVPGELLVLNDQVILTARSTGGQTVQTSAGELDILRFENVTLADNGDIFFSTQPFFRTGGDPARELANSVGLWRIINPGQSNQSIVPVIQVGDPLIISDSGLDDLFPGFIPPDAAEITGFNNVDIARSQGTASDGRPDLFSINAQGHVATIVQIDSASGSVDAIIAQDNNGDFHVVAFIGQVIDVDGQGDLRRITNFTAQFGSNDIDGAGDLFNVDEQLGFIVTLDRDNTSAAEFDQAVLRVSLNGLMTATITDFLFQGDCGDNFFGTLCDVAGNDGSNFVNANDVNQVADFVPGTDGAAATVTINGTDVRVSGIDVSLVSINSDSALTIENGASFEVTGGGSIGDLNVDSNSFTNGGNLSLDSLTITDGAEFANSGATTVEGSVSLAGDVTGNGLLTANDVTINENSAELVRIENRVVTDFLTVNEDTIFDQSVLVRSSLEASNVRISGDGDIEVLADFGSRATVNFNFGNAIGDTIALGTDLSLFNGDLNLVNPTNSTNFLTIDDGSTLTLGDDSQVTFDNTAITGGGQIIIQDGSSVTTRRAVLINTDLTFLNADQGVMSLRRALSVESGELNLSDTTFTRDSGMPGAPVDQSTDTLFTIAEVASVTLDAGNSITVTNDFVRLNGGGTLNLGGNLDVGENAVFENLSNINITDELGVSVNVSGEGLFRNRGTLMVENDAVFDVLFDNSGGGTFEFEPFSLTDPRSIALEFRIDALDAIDSPENLFARGIELLTGAANDLDSPSTDVGLLLQDFAFSTNGRVDVTGDAATFLIGETSIFNPNSISSSGILDVEGDLIVAGSITSSDRITIGDAGIRNSISIIDSSSDVDFALLEPPFLLVGNNRNVTIDNVDISGVSIGDLAASGGGSIVDPGDDTILFQNRVGANVLNDVTRDEGDEMLPINQDVSPLLSGEGLLFISGVRRLELNDSSIDNLTFDNDGIAVFNNVRIDDNVTIDNNGLLIFNGDQTDVDDAIFNNGSTGFIQLSAAADITNSFNNAGTLFGGPDAGTINIASLVQAAGTGQDSEPTGRLAAAEGAIITVAEASLLTGPDDNAVLAGRLAANGGNIVLQNDGATPTIQTIGQFADIRINGEGSVNNVDANGDGLRQINGRLDASGRFAPTAGDRNLSIGSMGNATFDRGIVANDLQIDAGGRLELGDTNDVGAMTLIDLQSADISGTLDASHTGEPAAAQLPSMIGDLTIRSAGTVDLDGDLTVNSASVRGNLDIRQNGMGMLSGQQLTVSTGGVVQIDLLDVDLANVSGTATVRQRRDSGRNTILNVLNGGTVNLQSGESLSTLNIAEGGTLNLNPVTNSGTVGLVLRTTNQIATQIDGRLDGVRSGSASSGLVFADSLNIGAMGFVDAVFVDAETIDIAGRLLVRSGSGNGGALTITDGPLNIAPAAAPNYMLDPIMSLSQLLITDPNDALGGSPQENFRAEVLSSKTNLIAAQLTGLVNGFTNAGSAMFGSSGNQSTVLRLNVDAPGSDGQSYTGLAGSYIDVEGNAAISGNVSLAQGALWQQIGNLNIGGSLNQNGGRLLVFGNANIDEDVTIAGGAETFVTGDFVARDVTVNGVARFSNGSFDSLDVSPTAEISAITLNINNEFVNDSRFIIGSPDGSGGFINGAIDSIGGFIQSNFFGGSGTVNGDFNQTASMGNPMPVTSPGFSPGIINITGDANFNDGVVLFEIGGLTPGTEHDQINVGGNLTIGSNAMIVVDLLDKADGSGIFLPQTGDEIVIFTAADISPDDVEQINFSIVDDLPLGFALIPDISQNGNGEIFRVLRGFNGSTLAGLNGLDPSQSAVAGAIDFLSSGESGVPSPELFALAAELQFNEDSAAQLDSLTALSGTTVSALQGSAFRAGSYGLRFAQNRLDRHDPAPADTAVSKVSGSPLLATTAQAAGASGAAISRAWLASALSQSIASGGETRYEGRDGSQFRVIGGASYHIGNQDNRLGVTGFDEDGWSANLGLEFENADNNLLIGAVGTLGESEADLDGTRGIAEAESAAISIYGQYRTGIIALSTGYSLADITLLSQRQVLGASANGNFDGTLNGVFGRLSATFVDQGAWTAGPEVTITHSDLDIDAYTETGAGAFNLAISSLDRKSTELDLAMKSSIRFDTGDWDGNILLKAGYQWALSGDRFSTAPTSFALAPTTSFTNPLRPLINDGLDLSISANIYSASGLGLSLGYDGFFGNNGQNNHDLSFRASIAF